MEIFLNGASHSHLIEHRDFRTTSAGPRRSPGAILRRTVNARSAISLFAELLSGVNGIAQRVGKQPVTAASWPPRREGRDSPLNRGRRPCTSELSDASGCVAAPSYPETNRISRGSVEYCSLPIRNNLYDRMAWMSSSLAQPNLHGPPGLGGGCPLETASSFTPPPRTRRYCFSSRHRIP